MRSHLATFVFLVLIIFQGNAVGQECSQTIEANDLVQYTPAEISVSSYHVQFTVTLRHVAQLPVNIMGHDWALTATPDYMPVVVNAQAMGPPNYLPKSDPRIIGATDMIGGGQEASVTFDISGLQRSVDYTYFCSFPGHNVLMNGKLIVG